MGQTLFAMDCPKCGEKIPLNRGRGIDNKKFLADCHKCHWKDTLTTEEDVPDDRLTAMLVGGPHDGRGFVSDDLTSPRGWEIAKDKWAIYEPTEERNSDGLLVFKFQGWFHPEKQEVA
jgi:hypothetical protein